MAEAILINVAPGEVRGAVLDGGRIVELIVARDGRSSHVGSIHLGRVRRILPGMGAAFVEIGLDRDGYLGLDGTAAGESGGGLHEGQAIEVQVVKDAAGSKGVQLARRIALTGHYLIHTPSLKHIAVSRRIADKSERRRLLEAVDATSGPGRGFIVRTAAGGAPAAALAAEAERLLRCRREIADRGARAAAPALLYEEPGPAIRLIRDRAHRSTARICMDSAAALAAAKAYCAVWAPCLADRLAFHDGPDSIFTEGGADIEEAFESVLTPRVPLPSGGEIVIQATEALTAVDVNSGGFHGRRPGDTALATNLEAADEAARQLRLRDIGGLIVVDFIHMTEGGHWRQVLAQLSRRLANDRGEVRMLGRSAAGLVEITRRRQRESPTRMMTEPCTACGESGRVATVETVARDIVRALGREARAARPGRLTVEAAGEVVDALEAGIGADPDRLETRLGRRVLLARNPSFPRMRYEVAVEDRPR